MRAWVMLAALVGGLVAAPGCSALLDRACQAGHERGPVAAFEGVVDPGQVISWTVPYDQQGTQNDVRIHWPSQKDADGLRLRLFATSAACTGFVPPATPDRIIPRGTSQIDPSFTPGDPCEVMSGRSFTQAAGDTLVQYGLTTSGGPKQGRPDFRAYKLHLVGDASASSPYKVSIEWWRGPSC